MISRMTPSTLLEQGIQARKQRVGDKVNNSKDSKSYEVPSAMESVESFQMVSMQDVLQGDRDRLTGK